MSILSRIKDWLKMLFKQDDKNVVRSKIDKTEVTPSRKLQPNLPDDSTKPQIIKVSDELKLTVHGLPPSLPRKERNQILTSLVKNTVKGLPNRSYNVGENVYAGKAHLKSQNQVYEIIYSLDVTRALAAIEVYKQAFDQVLLGSEEGYYDKELAEITAEYFKQSAWREIQQTSPQTQKDTSLNEDTPGLIIFPKETE